MLNGRPNENSVETAWKPQLIEAMMRHEFYPHPCRKIELVQTMRSWLLFAGEFVYKIKKPVHFRFVDATTLAERFRLCREEVLLNRRLAPEVYVGVRGITQRLGDYALIQDVTVTQQDVCEFAVVMHRLPDNRMLDRMVSGGTVSSRDISELAKKLAAFQMQASTTKSKVWGSANAIFRLVMDDLAETRQLIADSVARDRLATVSEYLHRYISSHWQSLDNRARDGYVRDGHGDLRCDTIYFLSTGLAILDCIEYSEKLRYGDAASDVASLALDLELAERVDLADALVAAYVAESDDARLLDLLRFYKCYRAIFRGKLEILLSLQKALRTDRRMLARSNASRFFALAENLATAPAPYHFPKS
ncbi:MAG TPA: hypothetical protein VMD75_08970 [Candidatus Binataceae bacterium]|nr:hypothetical protein [Candidatus Binataceae bacterium]